jgi:hypothetical protein
METWEVPLTTRYPHTYMHNCVHFLLRNSPKRLTKLGEVRKKGGGGRRGANSRQLDQ